jgi:hypothetical protein
LLSDDVTWNKHGFSINIKHSKSDPFNKGHVQPFIARTADKYCPVLFLRKYLQQEPLAKSPGQPLFVVHNRAGVAFVTAAVVTAALRKHAHVDGLKPTSVSARSLRSAGAFQMANAGQSWETIRVRGRWAFDPGSRMVLMYARTGVQRLQQQADSRTIEGVARTELWGSSPDV